ncbi:hypothetical protein [Mycobacterium yunnanensis]|uniref:hypothetical protein n=1 Tax=Mycobacterium yunnanensis TaxID=368477 RepID=UPI0021F2BE4D|nr:hypothetical protein [Mycobacterium yunnanensis]
MTNEALFLAARRLTSAFCSGHGDTFIEVVEKIDDVDGWKAVAIALTGDVTSLALQVHGEQAQDWLDGRIAAQLDRSAAPHD